MEKLLRKVTVAFVIVMTILISISQAVTEGAPQQQAPPALPPGWPFRVFVEWLLS